MSRRDDLLAATRAALYWWARLNHSELPGWARTTSMERVLTDRGTGGDRNLPQEVEQVESAINDLYKTEPCSRKMILLHYLSNGTQRQKQKYLRLSRYGYETRLERAEYAVKIRLGW